MKIKVFSAMSEKRLENKVNEFLSSPDIELKEIKFQASFGIVFVLITYEPKYVK